MYKIDSTSTYSRHAQHATLENIIKLDILNLFSLFCIDKKKLIIIYNTIILLNLKILGTPDT